MIFRPSLRFDTGCAAYVLGCGGLGRCAGSACGAGINGEPSSAIGFERRWSAALRLDRDAFVAALAEVPPRPAEMERLLPANRGEP